MQQASAKIIRLNGVKDVTGLSRSSIYAFIKDGTFPKPISLGLRAVGWVEAEVLAWIANRVTASR